jgi:hypothetical protein
MTREWVVFILTAVLCSAGVVLAAVLLAALVGWTA